MACGRLLERLNLSKMFWVKNYIKTVTASTLVGTGIGLIVTGELTRMHNHGWSDAELILGGVLVVLAFLITLILDLWTKNQEEKTINNIEDYIDERAEEIAEKKVLHYLNQIADE